MKGFYGYGRRRLINQTIRHVLPKSYHHRSTTLREYSHAISSTITDDCQSPSKIFLIRQTHTLRTEHNSYFVPHYQSSFLLPHHELSQRRQHSTSSTTNDDDDDKSSSKNTPPKNNKSLRRFASPFISLCHPDRFSSIESARNVNLNAIQTLNQMIDAVESSSSSSQIDVTETYVIEFMVPSAMESSQKNDDDDDGPRRCTRREVTLTFPSGLLDRGRRCVGRREYESFAQQLTRRARNEIGKLLRAAGVPPIDVIVDDDDDDGDESSSSDERRSSRRPSGFGGGRPRTHFERTREEFTSQLDYFALKKMHDEGMEGYRRDMATSGLTDPQKKQKIINNLVARVRIAEGGDEEDVPVAEQLIALRRISLLMDAHFDIGDLEMMGRVWETLVIVLTVGEGDDGPRKKRWRRRGETGFKFSLDEDDIVTVTMPLEFTDDVFVKEMKENLDKLTVREGLDEDTLDFNFLSSF